MTTPPAGIVALVFMSFPIEPRLHITLNAPLERQHATDGGAGKVFATAPMMDWNDAAMKSVS